MKSKVAVIPCQGYDEFKVNEAIKKGISLLGGWESFVKPEEKILLKPNLLNRADVERAVTTHPAVFRAVARNLLDNGYLNVTYGDSPGHPGSVEKTAEACGIKAVADDLQIALADFAQSKTIDYVHGRTSRRFEISQGVLDSDAIINICKMKTHQLERITGAVKNMFGCVHGIHKGAAHVKYPDAESFAKMLIDLNFYLKPRLHIMDGIVAMEGNGPASGNPVNMNVILMSGDPVALDSTFCRLVNLNPAEVPTVYYGSIYGLGNWENDKIEIVGVDDLIYYCNPKFDVAREKKYSGKWAVIGRLASVEKRPVILKKKCIRCGACIRACPLEEKALYFPETSGSTKPRIAEKGVPVYNYKKCIKCYCCQEMCPERAIVVKRKFIPFI
ncbi:MAG: DUF362 domain-containing protein [Anaerovoracaceae bacterium]|nr:DUF362 domain-containing protein [Clostridiales bacterium]